ncbi:DUF72 domain-containing protein [Sphingomonas morindae]|uniref:DUF72 domain-containing protein n=1 Tax=Sphingomonas morindae TaxID=1541170 RepID=A0ABY4XBL5_9SPHN|nr:DUF72 domain-containing protein [Sphingomonas morindae]USI74352.1 DUF72 domain-containing protein [Sphingomonas morindae]
MQAGRIRIGIGGWIFPPWRGSFYPAGWPQARELDYAASRLTAIEVNGTYYSRQKPATFAAWAKAAPDGFVFALKASRFCTNRRVLADAGEGIARFLDQGLVELGDRLGPILWQFMPTKRFDAEDFGAFLRLLPAAHGGLPLQHVVDVRHESFVDPAFIALIRAAGVALVHTDSSDYPAIGDASGPIRYARLMAARAEEPTGYAAPEIARFAALARDWAAGGDPDQPFAHAAADPAPARPRDTFLFYINGAKLRAPHAALATIAAL